MKTNKTSVKETQQKRKSQRHDRGAKLQSIWTSQIGILTTSIYGYQSLGYTVTCRLHASRSREARATLKVCDPRKNIKNKNESQTRKTQQLH